jgi:hypothetical protein
VTQIYQLELATPTPLEEVARRLHAVAVSAGAVAADVDPAQLVDSTVTLRSGLWVDVSPADDEPGPDQFAVDFGLQRTVSVGLQVAGSKDPEPQMQDLLSLVFGLLDRVPGDAVLHYEHTEVWLLRRGDLLVINRSDDIWHPAYLARAPLPHERADLAFSDVTPSQGASG